MNPRAVLIMWGLTMGMAAAIALGGPVGIAAVGLASAAYVIFAIL